MSASQFSLAALSDAKPQCSYASLVHSSGALATSVAGVAMASLLLYLKRLLLSIAVCRTYESAALFLFLATAHSILKLLKDRGLVARRPNLQ